MGLNGDALWEMQWHPAGGGKFRRLVLTRRGLRRTLGALAPGPARGACDRGRPSHRPEWCSHLVHGGRRPTRESGTPSPSGVAARRGVQGGRPIPRTRAARAPGGVGRRRRAAGVGGLLPGAPASRCGGRGRRPVAGPTKGRGWTRWEARSPAPHDALPCPLPSLPVASPIDMRRGGPGCALWLARLAVHRQDDGPVRGHAGRPPGRAGGGAGRGQGGVCRQRARAEGQRVDALRQPRRRGPRRRGGDDLRASAGHAGETRARP